MSISAAQLIANQNNAKKSTGPVTVQGKQTVSNNAFKHGVFSKTLILTDEDPDEYKNLLDQLFNELHPTGLLEQTLVERIALTLWRQKRLVRAKTANIESGRCKYQVMLYKAMKALRDAQEWRISSCVVADGFVVEDRG
jgi:hypothetical protein